MWNQKGYGTEQHLDNAETVPGVNMNRGMMDTTWIVHGKYLVSTWMERDYENNVHANFFVLFSYLLDCVVRLFC